MHQIRWKEYCFHYISSTHARIEGERKDRIANNYNEDDKLIEGCVYSIFGGWRLNRVMSLRFRSLNCR